MLCKGSDTNINVFGGVVLIKIKTTFFMQGFWYNDVHYI